MARCIWIGCELDAWQDGEERSHFCIDHAWRAAMRGTRESHFVPNDAQRARMATFPDALSNRAYFPVEYIEKRLQFRPRTNDNSRWPCRHCGRLIISSVTHCGGCRVKLGLERDEVYQVTCSNFGEPGPGRYLNKECLGKFPQSQAMRPKGTERVFCPPCMTKLQVMGKEWRLREGYDF